MFVNLKYILYLYTIKLIKTVTIMTNFLKVSEAPKTKLQLKKAILNGTIFIFEKDMNSDMPFRLLEKPSSIINLWEGFRYAPKYQGDTNIATAYLGTSFYYKFTMAN